MKHIIEELEWRCDEIIDNYLEQEIPKKNESHVFGRQMDFAEYHQTFVRDKAQEMIDIANDLSEGYDGDKEKLKEFMNPVLQEKLREGLVRIKAKM